MVSDAEGLAWLLELENRLANATVRGGEFWCGATKSVPDPKRTRDALGHLIWLVERLLREPTQGGL